MIRQMQNDISQKEKKLKGVIDDLTRKSNLNEKELLFLKTEIENERRKSMADEQKVKKLEQILNENAKKTEDKIRILSEELDAERRKSMVDEQRAMNL